MLEFERSWIWRDPSVKPVASGLYLIKYLVPFSEELDISIVNYDRETDSWYDFIAGVLSCVAWMPIPYPYQGSRAVGYC